MSDAANAPVKSGIIGLKQLKLQALFTGAAAVLSGIFFIVVPDCPFDRRLAWVSLSSALIYFTFFLIFDRLRRHMETAVLCVSSAGVLMLTFVIHMTGGIASPLVCFYLAILVSELSYGVTSHFSLYACAASYLFVVLGEAYGFLRVGNGLAAAIYANKPFFIFVAGYVLAHIAITGYFGRVILTKLRSDFSEEQKEHQVLLSKLRQLESFSQVGMLAHRIVHDIRGPLGAISGYIQLQLRSAGKDSADIGLLTDLTFSVEKMTALLESVARFGRSEAPKKETIRLAEFFRNLVSVIGYHKSAAGVEFALDFSHDSPLSVTASSQDLKQVYFNILKNALEALEGKHGRRKIDISVREAGGRAEVSVVNNGPRVPEEILLGLFRTAATSKENGTGVGMLIAHDLLRKNNGSIEICNLGDTGVKVTTLLPLFEGE